MSRTLKVVGLTGLLAVTLTLGVLAGGVIGGVAAAQGPTGGPFGFRGMMGGYGGMMGGYGGMMGGWGYSQGGTPITLDQAVAAATRYVAAYNNPDLTLEEVMEFDNHFYLLVQERSTGTGAFEILVDRYSGLVRPEPGPNMMWNTKYGHMGGMMAGFGGMMGGWSGWYPLKGTEEQMPISVAEAREFALSFLSSALPGATLSDGTGAFYGYYTIDVKRDGKDYGMLSVNGFGGQVWYHNWHGSFIQEKELG